jgi:hypothetical protein
MFCPKCSYELKDGANFCFKCGARVAGMSSAAGSPPPQPAYGAPAPPAYGAPPPAYGAPGQAAYGASAQPAYGAPPPPAYGAPGQAAYGAAPAYSAPPPFTGYPAASTLGIGSAAGPVVYASGKKFVVPTGATLPNMCVKCGAMPQQPWWEHKFSWHSPMLYVLLALSPLIYAIVAAIASKKVTLAVPLCFDHRASRDRLFWIGAGLMIGCIPLPIAIGMLSGGNDEVVGFAILLGVVMLFAGAIVYSVSNPIKPTKIDDQSAEFTGAGNAFRMALPQVPYR